MNKHLPKTRPCTSPWKWLISLEKRAMNQAMKLGKDGGDKDKVEAALDKVQAIQEIVKSYHTDSTSVELPPCQCGNTHTPVKQERKKVTVKTCSCRQAHNKVFGKAAIYALTEARMDASVCRARVSYLEAQVKGFIEYFNDVGENGKEIALSLHERYQAKINREIAYETKMMEEIVWTTSREDDDQLLDLLSGQDDMGFRLGEEEDLHSEYWGMLHNIAYKVEKRCASEEGQEIFEKAQDFCDLLEEHFDSSKEKPLHRDVWGKAVKAKKRINLHRFTLKTITYEQWATVSNHLNELMSVDKRYEVEMEIAEDVAWEIEQVFYTRD